MSAEKIPPGETPESGGDLPSTTIWKNEKAMKLVAEMMAGRIIEIKPQLDFATELGFSYPVAEQILETKGEEVASILESMVSSGILKKDFFDKILSCPVCQSLSLRPGTHCPKCSSGNIARGRILEHLICNCLKERIASS